MHEISPHAKDRVSWCKQNVRNQCVGTIGRIDALVRGVDKGTLEAGTSKSNVDIRSRRTRYDCV